MRVFYWIGLFLLAVVATAAASVHFLADLRLLKTATCFDATKVVHVFGCGPDFCEVVIDDGAIIRVPPDQAIVGSTVCLDERK